MKTDIRQIQRLFLSAVAVAALSCAAVAGASPDAMRGPALKDVRLEGWLGEKMDRFISRRLAVPDAVFLFPFPAATCHSALFRS